MFCSLRRFTRILFRALSVIISLLPSNSSCANVYEKLRHEFTCSFAVSAEPVRRRWRRRRGDRGQESKCNNAIIIIVLVIRRSVRGGFNILTLFILRCSHRVLSYSIRTIFDGAPVCSNMTTLPTSRRARQRQRRRHPREASACPTARPPACPPARPSDRVSERVSE